MTPAYSPTRRSTSSATAPLGVSRDELTDVTCVTLVALILLGRFAIPVGSGQAPLVTLLLPVYVAWLAWRGHLQLSKFRLALFFCVMSLASISTILNASNAAFSPLSFLYLWIIYSITVFTTNKLNLQKVFNVFSYLMVAISLVGIVQFAVQLVGISSIDPLALFPEQIVLKGYNTYPALYYGAALHKPNAIVMLEPSHLSKALAVAILIELLGRQRKLILLCFLACYAVTFSGTGIIALIVGLPFVAFALSRKTILWGGAFAVLLILGISLSGFADVWVGRVNEFDNDSSSATARFVNPYVLLDDLVNSDHLLFGNGPGSLPGFDAAGHEISPPAEVKLAYEYGAPTALLFSGFIIYCVCASSAPWAIRSCVLVTYFLLGGSLLEPMTVYFCFLLSMLPVEDRGVTGAQS